MTEIRFCSHCGASLDENDIYCPRCGAKVEKEEKNCDARYEPNQGQSYPETHSQPQNESTSVSNGTLTLVFGILSLVLGGILWTILAFVFASKADANDQKTKVGKILAIIGAILWTIVFILQIVQISLR